MTSSAQQPSTLLNLEQRRAFEAILYTFSTPGWKLLEQQLKQHLEQAQDVRNCNNLDYTKGRVDVFDTLVNWELMWNKLYEGAQSGAVEVDPEFGRDPSL